MKPSFDPLSSHPRWSYSMSLPLFLQGSIDGSESAAESTGDISFQTKGAKGQCMTSCWHDPWRPFCCHGLVQKKRSQTACIGQKDQLMIDRQNKTKNRKLLSGWSKHIKALVMGSLRHSCQRVQDFAHQHYDA